MGAINIPRGEQEAILAIDPRQMEQLIDQALNERSAAPLVSLQLDSCGPYVSTQFRNFKTALVDFSAAKAYRKAEETEQSARRAGRILKAAVAQMRYRVEQEQAEGLRFRIDDDILPPLSLNSHLWVRISFSWRPAPDAEWQHGSIEFTHEVDLRPDYTLPQPKRKPSVAKQKLEIQDRLHREWDHLKLLGLCSLRDYFREGRHPASIPNSFKAKAGSRGRGLNNHSTRFWLEKT